MLFRPNGVQVKPNRGNHSTSVGSARTWKPQGLDVELISFRETRSYVKRVLQNRRIYRALYDRAATAAPVTAPASSGRTSS